MEAQDNIIKRIVITLLFSFAIFDIGKVLLSSKHIEHISDTQNPNIHYSNDDHDHQNDNHHSQDNSDFEQRHPKSISEVKFTSENDEIQANMKTSSKIKNYSSRELIVRYCTS